MAFFVLKVGRFAQYRYAWFEVAGRPNYAGAPECPTCRRAVGMLTWLPPHRVALKQSKQIGDFVSGAGGCPFLCQSRVVEQWHAQELGGMDQLYPIEISRVGTTRRANESPRPTLFGVNVPHSLVRVEHDQMNVDWAERPHTDYCRTCGPGGGGREGIIRSWQRVVVNDHSWNGEDLFFAVNLPGTILVSERAAQIIRSEGWSNVTVVPAEEYVYPR
jgi:hypothetical protein